MKSLRSDLIANIIDLFCYNICIGVAGYRLPLCSREIVVNFSHVRPALALAYMLFAWLDENHGSSQTAATDPGLLLYFDYEIFRFFFSAPFSIPCCLYGYMAWHGCPCVECGRPSRRGLPLVCFLNSVFDSDGFR